jgi:hypothetical protein
MPFWAWFFTLSHPWLFFESGGFFIYIFALFWLVFKLTYTHTAVFIFSERVGVLL